MPETWFNTDFAVLRKQTAVPEELTFQTKNELATAMIYETVANTALPLKWIGYDAAFGCDRAFLEFFTPGVLLFCRYAQQSQFVFEARPELTVSAANNKCRPFKHHRPSFPPVKVSKYAKNENLPYQQISLAEWTKGPILADVKIVRCVSCHSSTLRGNYLLPQEEVWLYIRRYNDGRIKYSLCNAPADTPLEMLHRVTTMC